MPTPSTEQKTETLDHIADRIAYKYLDKTVASAKLKSEILSALRNAQRSLRERERKQLTTMIEIRGCDKCDLCEDHH